MPLHSSFLSRSARTLRQALPWALTLAVATCTNDGTGPSEGGTGFFTFRPVYQGVTGSLSRFGVVADSVHVRLTRPIDELVLDTTVFFHPDSNSLNLALPIELESSPESLTAVVEIKAGATLLFVDSLDVQVFDGPPSATQIPTVLLDYVGPGNNMAVLTLIPDDTTIAFGDTIFFNATAVDSSAQSIPEFYVAWSTSNPGVATINGQGRLIAPSTRTTIQVIGETPTGIADTTLITFAPIPNAILADSGNAQTGVVGDSLGALFVARVMAGDALGVAGIPVRFQVVTGGGAVRDTVLVTDANGRVRTRGALSTTAGAHSWSATVIGTAITTTFTATANAGLPAGIAIQGGNLQTDSAGRTLPNPFAVRVTDAFTNPVPGVKIYWTRTVGNGSLAADSTFTNASGDAIVAYTLGAVGIDSVTATIAGTGAFVSFQATAINGVPAIVNKVLGDAQAGSVGTLLTDSLAVTVRSATNQPVVGTPVAWTVLRGGSVSVDTTLTDVSGRAAVTYSLGGAPGVDSVRAQAGAASAIFTADAQTGVATSIAIVSGNDQTDTLLTAIDLPFVVRVTDALTNPVAGEAVAFTVITGTGTLFADTVLTNVAGEVAVGYLLGGTPGIDSIRATLVGTGGSVDFALNVVAGVPTTLSEIGGNLQFDTAHAVLATPMQVRVLDTRGNPVPGAEVTFAGTGGLIASPATDTSDLNGDVSALITLGDSAGSWQVTATVTGVPVSTSFDFTTSEGQAAIIALVSGDGQTDSTGNALPLPFVARVTDAYGNPVPGAAVLWAVQVGSGNATDDTTFTDITGHTQVNYVLGGVEGADTVRATIVGTSAFVDFTANAISGAPAFLALISGNNQVDTVLSTLADSLIVELRDVGNNPVPGEWIFWTTAGMFVSADSSLTDANGRAAVQVTFDSIAFQGVVLAHTADTLIGTPFVLRATAGTATQITPFQGLGQSGEVNTALPIDFGVFVQDNYGNPAQPGVPVTWTNIAGFAAAGLPDTTVTDSTGLAYLVAPTLGAIVGEDSLEAQILGQPATALFTATATSGAASALVYVSGTGQSDTVGQALGASFVVQARDGSSNPVPGAWVTWYVSNGNGSIVGFVGQDSIQTDAAGVASIDFVLGTNLAIGTDSVVAFIQGGADTVYFYAVAVPDTPSQLNVFGGDGQAGTVGGTLASLDVQIFDQYNNPIIGLGVDYTDLSGTGITFANPSTTTNSAGVAGSGTVTLGATPGSHSIAATSPAMPGDTAYFTLVTLPSGTSATWTGALSTAYGTAGNWSPAAVPTSSDNIFIPAAVTNFPVLSGPVNVGGVELEAGASLDLGAQTMTVLGDATFHGTVTRTTGAIAMNSSTGTFEGTVPYLFITATAGTVTLSGPTTVTDSLRQQGGTLVVGGQDLVVDGALSVVGTGAFAMTNAADSVDVAGNTTFNGSTAGGLLTNGVLVARGGFSAPSSSSTFMATGGHTTVFAGVGAQSIAFPNNNGPTGNRFQNLTLNNAAGVAFTSPAYISGNVDVQAGTVTGTGFNIGIGGSLTDPANGAWLPTTTSFSGSPASFPDTIAGNVTFNGAVSAGLSADLRVKGVLTFNGAAGASFALNGFNFWADSALTVAGSHQVLMQSVADTLEVQGAISWNGSTAGGLLTDGVLIAHGSFTAPSSSSTFQGSGTHTTVFAGSTLQTVSFPNNNGVGGNRFQNATFANPAGVSFTSAAYISGVAEVQAGLITGSGANVSIGGHLIDPADSAWRPTTTTFTGIPSSFPGTIVSNVVFNGAGTVTLGQDLRITRSLTFSGTGQFSLGGFNLWADSTLTVIGSHQVVMQNVADTLEVQDGINWNGSTAAGLLTDGVLIAHGNFTAPSSSSTFQASGTHKTVFAGSALQSVSFPNNNGAGSNRFQNVEFANAAGVSFTSAAYITGIADVQAGLITGSGVNVSLGGTLIDPANGGWRPTTTTFTGVPASFPDTLLTNVVFTGANAVALTSDLRVIRSLLFTGSGASFDLNGFNLWADSTLTVLGSHQVIMQDAADTLEVAEGINWNGSTAAGLLTAGTLIAHGDFTAPSSSSTFQASGTHSTIFAGNALQTISFPNNNGAASNRFQNVTFANAAGVSFSSGAYITGIADVQAGLVTGSGAVISLGGTLLDPANGAWRPTTTVFTGTPASFPDTLNTNTNFASIDTIILAKDLRVIRALTFSGSTGARFVLNGFNLWADSTLAVSGGHQFVMQNAADTLDVAEGITWNGSTLGGLLTAGTIIARADFTAPSSSSTFQATGTHEVVFAGTALQTVGFPNNSGSTSNRFQNATFANAAGVNFSSDAYITGIADVQAGTVTAPGAELALGGTLLDPANGAWQPTVMTYRGVPTSFPDTLNTTVNFTAADTITLVKDLRVKGALVFVGNTGARFEVNGFNLWADSSFYIVSAHQFVMQNAADTLEVEDEISWTGATTPGLLTAGTIIAHGDFTAPSSSSTFQPSGNHKTVFAAGVHSVTFPNNRSFTGNRFHHMEMVNPSTVTIGSDIFVAGTFSNVPGPTGTLMAAAPVALNTRGLGVNNLNFDRVRIAYSGPAAFQLDNASFTNQDPAQTQVAIRTAGGLSVAINGASFNTTPTTGRYISATDTLANATPLILAMVGSTPLDGSAFELENVANDGATIDWSTLAFVQQPLDAVLGSFLDSVTVVALGPNGDTLTGYTGNVTVALGANPGNASLTGTTTVAAVAGVATFTDLAVDSVGTGYTLTAGSGGLSTITSALFNISVFQPVGFDVVWVGGTSTDWLTPSNWNTGIVPDENTNVYISAGYPFDPTVAVQDTVNRLWVGPGATLNISAPHLAADSSMESDGTISGTLEAIGTGEIRGDLGSQVWIRGTYEVGGNATAFTLEMTGQLTVAADTLNIGFMLQPQGSAQFVMNDPAALVNVNFAGFSTSIPGTGMTDGTLRVSGNISAYGGISNPFAPSGNHVTEFVGTGTQQVDFFAPDPVTGSHFANVVFNGTGTVQLLDRVDALGTVTVLQGTVDGSQGIVAHQGFTLESAGILNLSELRTGGPLVNNGGTYGVATTSLFGPGAPIAIPAIAYDTLQIERAVTLAGATGVTGDLRILGPTDPARLDVAGNTLTVGGSVIINGDGALVMQNALDTVLVTGSFSTNGASTNGLLTAGWLRIGGSFDQAADGSSEAFRAGPNHTTEFYFGGPTGRHIEFDSPSGSPVDVNGSHFGALLLPIGFDTLIGRVPAAGKMFIAAATIQDTTFPSNVLAGYDSVVVLSASPSLQLRTLEVWGGLEVQGGVPYDVVNTRIMGGPNGTLAPLAYQNLLIANTSQTLGANLTLPGDLDVGFYCGEGGECSAPGDLTVNGFDLIIGGRLGVMGHGQLHMAAGDSVDVTGDLTYRTDPSAGNLTGGTLVARAMFNTVGANAYQPDAAHWTVFAAPGDADLYPTFGSRFGKLLVLDNGIRRIRSSQAVVVLDTLMIGNAASTFSDSVFSVNGSLIAQGPVVTVVGSRLRVSSARFDHNDLFISGSYLAGTTIFGGNGQLVPTSLTYNNVQVRGPYVFLNAPLDLGSNSFTIDGSAGPAEFDINGYSVAVGDFATVGQGTLLSTDIGSGLVVRGDATFNGGDQTGKLTEGGITFLGFFTQDSLTSLSSYVSSGNHTTVFADSSFGGSQAVLNSMSETTSRFNDVAVYGNGVLFWNQAWVMGDLRILDPMVDSVAGTALSLFGDLVDAVDAQRRYRVDTTNIRGAHPLLPDSIDGNVLFFAPDSLEQSLRIGGHLTIFDTLIPHPGGTLRVDSLFAATGNGLLVMTHPTQRVEIEGNAFFDGATSTGWLTAGVLKMNGGLFRGLANPLAFDATGSHTVYVDSISDGSVINFDGPGGGLQNLQIGSAGLTLNSDLLVRGDISVDGESPDPIFSSNRLLTVHGLVEQLSIFDNTRVAIPEQNTLFDVTFQNMDVTADQLTVFGDGSPEPLQLGNIRFLTVPTTGNLLRLVDTLADADSLLVEMMSSTPAQGDAYTAITGDGRAAWPKLVLNTFPVTVDSAVAFTITVGILNPDSSVGTTSIGNATIALEANPLGNTLGGTLNIPFGGVSASFNDLTLLLPGIGTSFRVSIDGRPTDTLVTPTLDILNPAPAGAVVFDNQGGDNLWSTALNWSTNVVPDVTDSVFIPGTMFVQYDVPNDTVGTLVLGAGAQLDLASSTNLTLTGRLTAGNTVTGSGTLYLDGAVTEVTGTIFPATYVTGTINALGTVTFNNGLTVDGAGADFNIAGATVTVNGIFGTSNGGVVTMDSPEDTLIVTEAFFNGGSTFNRLTAGTLILTGTDFSAAGLSPSSFAATGTHTTVFEDAGDNSNISLSNSDSSYFQNLVVRTPNSVLVSTPTARLTVWGDLALDDDGALTGDTLGVAGRVTMGGASANLTLGLLTIGGNGNLIQGNYNVPWTQYVGTGQDIAGAFYENLDLNGSVQFLAGDVVANKITASNGPVVLGGFNITTDSLMSVGTGAWIMNAAADSVVVNLFAQFSGASPAPPMTAGYLEIRGDFDVGSNANMFQATAGHTTRFVGAANHLVDFPGEGQFTPMGTVVIDTGTVVLEDDVRITGDLILRDGSLADSSLIREVRVDGGINADNGLGTHLMVGEVRLSGGLTFTADTSRFDVNELWLVGTGQTLPGTLHYRTIRVRGTTALSAHVWTDNLRVDSTGVLDLGGFSLQVDTVLNVTENGHLLMHDPADALNVGETAYFQGPNSTGDYTAGTIRARHFISQTGPSSDQTSFVQLGSNRIVPLSGDTISMWSGGPAGSMLKTLVLEGQGGPVYVGGPALWIADSLVIVQTADSLVGMSGTELIVGFASGVVGTVHIDLGTLAVEALGVGGPLSRNAGTYDVQLTKFIGSSQPIPGNFPFRDVEVQYSAFLTGDLTLTGAGQRFQVNNSGDFDLGGHRLAVDTFSTSGFGILRMDADADTLRADEAIFAGGSTVGTLTAGELEVGVLRQVYNADSTSFAASGTHQTTFLDIGGFTESGREVLFQTPHDTLSHFNRVRFLGNSGNRLLTNVYALDTVVIDNSINQFSGVSLVSAGPVYIGSAADIDIDTLRMGDTLVIDPSATTFLDNWVFGPTSKTPPAWNNYSEVFLEGNLTLQDSLHFPSGVTVRQGAVLTLNGNNFTTEYGFTLLDSARLVMVAGDTLFTGHATFSAGPTGTDLAGGLIRMSGQFWQSPFGDPASFSPTGTVVEFAVNGGQSIQFNNPGSSFFRDLRITGNTQMYVNTPMVVQGDVNIDGTSGIFDWSNGDIEFFGNVAVAPGGSLSDADALTSLIFRDTLTVGTPANFTALNTQFRDVDHVPNLPYQHLYLLDGVNLVLSDSLVTTASLTLQGSAPGIQTLDLNGQAIVVGGQFNTVNHGELTMDQPSDELVISSHANFTGASLAGKLTAGTIRIGGNFTQAVGPSGSNESFDGSGTLVEFVGTSVVHTASFATPGTGNSLFGSLAIQDGGTLTPITGITVMGLVDVDNSATLDFSSLTGADPVDLFGGMSVGSTGTISSPSNVILNFYDTLLVAAGGVYNVLETGFTNVDTLPSVAFGGLTLGDGTDITLAEDLVVSGQLTLTANFAGNQSLTLNGRKASALNFATATNGRLVMTNPNDSLLVNGDVSFDGADQTGFLTAGTIYVNNHFTQRDNTSSSSGRLDGTKLLFNALTPVHIVDIISPVQSPVAAVNAINGSNLTLMLANSLVSTGEISHAGLTINGVPGSSVTADTLRSTGGLLALTLSRVDAFHLSANGGTAYNVDYTRISGDMGIPAFTWDTLEVAGNGSIASFTVNANHVIVTDSLTIASTGTLTTTGDVEVPGYLEVGVDGALNAGTDLTVSGIDGYLAILKGAVTVSGDFATQTGGRFEMDSAEAGLTIAGNANIGGGSTVGLLKNGLMEVYGDFAQSGSTFSFVANGAHTTRFTNGGEHSVTLANSATTEFGELSFFSGGVDIDTLLFTSGQVRAVRFVANSFGRIRTFASTVLDVDELDVDGLTIEGVRVELNSATTTQPVFDNVTFTGFLATDVQLTIRHPGTGILDPTGFTNVDFDDVADGITGFFIEAEDTDGISTFLNIHIFGPDSGIGNALEALLSGALVSWFPPA